MEIENQCCLPRTPYFWRVGARPLLVKELVDEDTKQWNRDKNAHWFEPLTCRDILHIPLNNMHEKDTLTWNENRGRSFFVKTAYKVAKTSTPIIRWPLPSEVGRKSVEIYLGFQYPTEDLEFSMESLYKYSPYPSQSTEVQYEGGCSLCNMPTSWGNGQPYTLGMSVCDKCVGTILRKGSEMPCIDPIFFLAGM